MLSSYEDFNHAGFLFYQRSTITIKHPGYYMQNSFTLHFLSLINHAI